MSSQPSVLDNFTDDEIIHIKAVKERLEYFSALSDFRLTHLKVFGSDSDRHPYFISGGVFASLLQNEKPKDIDLWFYRKETEEIMVKLYTEDESFKNYVKTVEEKYRDKIPNKDGLCITENAITLKNGLQLITKNFGTPAMVRSTFDYVHCMPFWDSNTQKLYISPEQYDCCVKKKLKVNYPAAVSPHRKAKFILRGYTDDETNT